MMVSIALNSSVALGDTGGWCFDVLGLWDWVCLACSQAKALGLVSSHLPGLGGIESLKCT